MDSAVIGCGVTLVALAHVVPFEIVTPSGIGARTQDDSAVIQWSASDPQDIASYSLWAARGSVAPFGTPPRDEAVRSSGPVSDPVQVWSWDTRAVVAGCYQPFAVVADPIEGFSTRLAPGVIGVGPADGGNQPVVAWIQESGAQRAAADGRFALHFAVQDPDDAPVVTVRYLTATLDAGGTLVSGLSPDGGAFEIDTAQLVPSSAWYVQLEAVTPTSACAVWWQGLLLPSGAPPPDAGSDAGVDAGSDGGADAGTTVPPPPRGCGCGSANGAMLALAALVARRRPSQSFVMRPPSG